MSRVVAVVGASSDRQKFGNQAVRAFEARGYRVIPVNPREAEIEGHRCYPSLRDVPGAIDLVSLYVPPDVGARVMNDIAHLAIREVWINPGAEGPAVMARAKALGITPIVACSLIGLGRDEPGRR